MRTQIVDSAGSSVAAAVKAASTLPAATDPALVVTIRESAAGASVAASVAAAYRSAVVARDVAAAPGAVTCTKQAGGSAAAAEYTVYVVAGNTHGRTTSTAG